MFVKIRQNKLPRRQTKLNDVKMRVMTKYLTKSFFDLKTQKQ